MLSMQAEEYTSADAEVMELMDQHDKEKLNDPLAKLEHGNEVMARKKAQNARLLDLRDDSADKYKNDYEMNKLLRKNLRYSVTVQSFFLLALLPPADLPAPPNTSSSPLYSETRCSCMLLSKLSEFQHIGTAPH